MTATELAHLTDAPETHRLVVGDYDGQYALGVSDRPARLVLRVAASDTSRFPRRVVLRGESVPVEVTGGLAPVVPLNGRR
jgi:hypothetical protein